METPFFTPKHCSKNMTPLANLVQPVLRQFGVKVCDKQTDKFLTGYKGGCVFLLMNFATSLLSKAINEFKPAAVGGTNYLVYILKVGFIEKRLDVLFAFRSRHFGAIFCRVMTCFFCCVCCSDIAVQLR